MSKMIVKKNFILPYPDKMANICQAFSRIVPRYEFSPNQGVMVVEDLEHTLGRKERHIGYPPRRIYPMNRRVGACPQIPRCFQMHRCSECLKR